MEIFININKGKLYLPVTKLMQFARIKRVPQLPIIHLLSDLKKYLLSFSELKINKLGNTRGWSIYQILTMEKD